MKPLVFLTYRSLVNGIRRALTSPKRLLSLLGVVGYYFYFFMLPSLRGSGSARLPGQMAGQLPFPSMDLIDAVAFAVFAVLSLMMMLGMFAYRGGFRPADVDVLFATPISPKTVLGFRIVREYVGTLILPFFFVLFFYRPAADGWQFMFRNVPHPESSGWVFRAMPTSWIRRAMVWVSIAYAASLFVNRSDRQSDLNKRIITWTLLAGMVALGAFVAYRISAVTEARDLVLLAQSPVLRVTFFTATAASAVTLAPLQGSIWPALIGAASMVALIVVALKLALTQVGWLYDQAAVRGFDQQESRALQAKGDLFGMAAQKARTHKAKPQKKTRLHAVRVQGPLALLWKEFFLQKRGMQSLLLVLVVPAILMSLMPVLASGSKSGEAFGPIMFLVMQAVAVLMITMNIASTGFMEVLRRVDLQKPLPFTATTTAFAEITSKAAWAAAANGIAIVVIIFLRPHWWSYILASAVYSPTLSLVISATAFLVTVLFPDADDSSQRSFHRMILLLAVVILAAPAFFLGALLIGFGLAPPIAATAAGVVNVGVSLGLASIAGRLYSSFNPSE